MRFRLKPTAAALGARGIPLTDCGDTNCILRDMEEPGGQRTNGGCQHLKEYGPEASAQLRAFGAEVVRLRRIVKGGGVP